MYVRKIGPYLLYIYIFSMAQLGVGGACGGRWSMWVGHVGVGGACGWGMWG